MAPKYTRSLRGLLPPMALLLETVFILLFTFFTEYEDPAVMKNIAQTDLYTEFQDVNVMVILGFGFLATFLVRYGFSGSGFSLLVAALSVQWALLLDGFLFAFRHGKIRVGVRSLATANVCAASALISMGAVLGKTNPVQLMVMALLEVTGFMTHRWILHIFLSDHPTQNHPIQPIMLLHVFGAFFGLMVSWVLNRPGLEHRHEKDRTDRRTGLFATVGALFLWMFWPSFNSVLLAHEDKLMAVSSTYLSLATSTVASFLVSAVTSPRGKMNMIHIQNASLAGGVAVGVAISVADVPWVAMVIGLSAGLVSSLGFRYLKPHLQVVFKCHDTCGVLSVHGLPGILGWAFFILIRTLSPPNVQRGPSRLGNSPGQFSFILLVTLSLSLSLGALTGLLMKWSLWRAPQDRKCFDDQAYWEFQHLAERK
ncbi:rh blood group, D antigen [Conger conger]|uniref:rh blood group, D antigen n=1 Tax=Conger conger TaxID=82655 RepID=UPI002A5A0B5D|nr:rh blood group, D antigen [Conger conger]